MASLKSLPPSSVSGRGIHVHRAAVDSLAPASVQGKGDRVKNRNANGKCECKLRARWRHAFPAEVQPFSSFFGEEERRLPGLHVKQAAMVVPHVRLPLRRARVRQAAPTPASTLTGGDQTNGGVREQNLTAWEQGFRQGSWCFACPWISSHVNNILYGC